MLSQNIRTVGRLMKLFSNNLTRKFCTNVKIESNIGNDSLEINEYFKMKIENIINDKVKKSIFESINKSRHSMVLCDSYSNGRYPCALAIMNHILNKKENEKEEEEEGNSENTKKEDENQNDFLTKNKSEDESEKFFANSLEVFSETHEKAEENEEKQYIKPRGALIICEKFEFIVNFYKTCRMLDEENKLRIVRVGTTLHSVSPTVDLDPKHMTESDEYESQELIMGNVNLVNTTTWKNIDILFITPLVLAFIFEQKDDFDYFDINPEIILIEDFDFIINSKKYAIEKVLNRFFSPESKFRAEQLKQRKLILYSNSIHMGSLAQSENNFFESVYKSLDVYKNALDEVNKDMFSSMEAVISPNFMNLSYHTQGIDYIIKIFEGNAQNVLDKKFKYLQEIIKKSEEKVVICCSDSNKNFLKENLRKNKMKFLPLDDVDKLTVRVSSFILYKNPDYDNKFILLQPVLLKNLEFSNLKSLILFDTLLDYRSLIRITSRFSKTENGSSKPSLHLLCTNEEIENNAETIDFITKINSQ